MIKLIGNEFFKLTIAQFLVIFLFDHFKRADIGCAFSLLLCPARLYTVAAFNPHQRDRQLEFLCHFYDGGIQVFGFSAVSTVAFGSQRQRAALLDDFQTIADSTHIGGLFFDGDGIDSPA